MKTLIIAIICIFNFGNEQEKPELKDDKNLNSGQALIIYANQENSSDTDKFDKKNLNIGICGKALECFQKREEVNRTKI